MDSAQIMEPGLGKAEQLGLLPAKSLEKLRGWRGVLNDTEMAGNISAS